LLLKSLSFVAHGDADRARNKAILKQSGGNFTKFFLCGSVGCLLRSDSSLAVSVDADLRLSFMPFFLQSLTLSNGLTTAVFGNSDGHGHAVPRWPRTVFLAGAMTCLAVSAAAHLLACHSRRFSRLFWQLDYAGIAVMIVASFFPPVYYAFLGLARTQLVYLSAITLLGLLVVALLLAPARSSPRLRHLRAGLFVSMAFSGVLPALHALWLNWPHRECHLALALELAMGFVYAAGAGFYVTRVPERWSPGKFDCVGHSHQIFHALVIAGALAHYGAAIVFLKARDEMGCPAS